MTTVAPSNVVQDAVVIGQEGKTRLESAGYATSVTPRYDAKFEAASDRIGALPTVDGFVNTSSDSLQTKSQKQYQQQRPHLQVEALETENYAGTGAPFVLPSTTAVPLVGEVQQVQSTTVREVTKPAFEQHQTVRHSHRSTKSRGFIGRLLHFITTNLPLASLLGLMTAMLLLQSGMFLHGLRHHNQHHQRHVHQEVQATNYMVPQMGQTYWVERLQTLQSELGLLNNRMDSINRELGMARVQLSHCKDDARVIKTQDKKVVKEFVTDTEVEA